MRYSEAVYRFLNLFAVSMFSVALWFGLNVEYYPQHALMMLSGALALGLGGVLLGRFGYLAAALSPVLMLGSWVVVKLYSYSPFGVWSDVADAGRMVFGSVIVSIAYGALFASLHLEPIRQRSFWWLSKVVSFAGLGLGVLVAGLLLDNSVAPIDVLVYSAIASAMSLALLGSRWIIGKWTPVVALVYAAGVFFVGMWMSSSGMQPERSKDKIMGLIPQRSIIKHIQSVGGDLYFFDQPLLDIHRFGIWGLSPKFDGNIPSRTGISVFGSYYTSAISTDTKDDESRAPRFASYLLEYAGFIAIPGSPEDVLIDDSGGGLRIWPAIVAGTNKVYVHESNQALIDALKGSFSALASDVFNDHKTTILHTIGANERFSIISADLFYKPVVPLFSIPANRAILRERMEFYLSHLRRGGLLQILMPAELLPDAIASSIGILGSAVYTNGVALGLDDVALLILSNEPLPENTRERIEGFARRLAFEYMELSEQGVGEVLSALAPYSKRALAKHRIIGMFDIRFASKVWLGIMLLVSLMLAGYAMSSNEGLQSFKDGGMLFAIAGWLLLFGMFVAASEIVANAAEMYSWAVVVIVIGVLLGMFLGARMGVGLALWSGLIASALLVVVALILLQGSMGMDSYIWWGIGMFILSLVGGFLLGLDGSWWRYVFLGPLAIAVFVIYGMWMVGTIVEVLLIVAAVGRMMYTLNVQEERRDLSQ